MMEKVTAKESLRKRPSYVYCFVPLCKSTGIATPGKVFVSVPNNPALRRKWLIAARRDLKKMPLSESSHLRCCADHFNLEEDAENYMRWKMMGGPIRIRKGVVPHVFKCQSRPSNLPLTKRSVLKKRLVNELLQASKSTEVPKKPGIIPANDDEVAVFGKHQDIDFGNRHGHDTTADKSIQHHFDKNQWEPHRADGKRKLKPNAVPTVFSTVRTPRKKQKRKQLDADEDEVIEYIESLEAKKHLPRCVVCSRLLRESKKEFLSTLTSTTGLSLHQCLIGISVGKSTNIQDLTASDMVCFYCAHLINYADALEAELVKLKNAINGCLEIQSMNDEDQEMLKPEFDSHIVILDEYSERVVGPGSAAEREEMVDEDQGNETPEIVIKNIVSIPENSDKSQLEDKGKGISEDSMNSGELNSGVVDGDISPNPEKIVPPTAHPDKFQCKICKLRTSSSSVLLFHLRRHMAQYKWCDFCDLTISNEDKEKLFLKCDPT